MPSNSMAMFAKQAWILLTNPESLCARVLATNKYLKYFPQGDVLQAKPKRDMSYTWHSIMSGLSLLKKAAFIWRIGDGASIRMWEDEWLPRDDSRRPFTPRGHNLLSRVQELINPATGSWDEVLIRDMFWEEDATCILCTPSTRRNG
jgi:hypothetical protein